MIVIAIAIAVMHMPDGQPDTEQDEPDDVADRRAGARPRLVDDGVAERPQRMQTPMRKAAKPNGIVMMRTKQMMRGQEVAAAPATGRRRSTR